MDFNLTLLYMLKSKSKTPKRKAQKKKVNKAKRHKINKHHKNNYETQTVSHFIPTQTNAIQSHAPQITHQMTGGIPYTSSLESFGVSNKPPYFLESLIAKSSPMTYSMPVPSSTSTTLTGANTMIEPKSKAFEEQTKSQSVDYVDLVEPYKKGNMETQPDFILIDNEESNDPYYGNDAKYTEELTIKDKTKRKRRTKLEMDAYRLAKQKAEMEMTDEERMLKKTPNTKPSERANTVKQLKKKFEERIEKNKKDNEQNERKSKIPSLRGFFPKKNNQEL
jgi:hypothetical protein